MSFMEIYNILKSEKIDKICFVETGSFFVTIGSDAECLSMVLELSKICFSEGVCKVGFPSNSLSKYIKIMHDMGMPYVIYGYVLDDNTNLKVEIEYNGKKYTKLSEVDGDRNIAKRIERIYSTFKPDCNRCEYRKVKILKEIKSCDRRKEKLKLELQRMLQKECVDTKEYINNINRNENCNFLLEDNITLFDIILNDNNR